MITYSSLLGTFLPMSVGIYRMELKSENRLISLNAGKVTNNSTSNFYHNTGMRRGYKGVTFVAPLGQTMITEDLEDELQQSVKKIKRIMAKKLNKPSHMEELVMIDAIKRLGLEMFFQDDIYASLDKHYETHCSIEGSDGECLHDVALRFRLLRQQGYHVSQDTFTKFKDNNGKFKQEITKDVNGIMTLYEASHLKFAGDHLLDEAGEFSVSILKGLKEDEEFRAEIIGNTLKNPCHKSWARLTSKIFLRNFEGSLKFLHDFNGDGNWIREVQNLARVDAYLAKINHQSEITQVTRWWKEIGLIEELKLARNQPEKWHTWSLVCLPGLNMAEERVEFTKAISFVFIIDDIFDMYGTLEELILFTEAIDKWEYDNVKGLPNYMTICLEKLFQVTEEMSVKTYIKYGWNPKDYLQKAWAELCNAFLVEAKWFASGHTPSTDEYLENGRISSGVGVVCAYLFLLLGEGDNNTRIDLLNSLANIVHFGGTILRLSDDLGSGKDDENGNDGSYVNCYMNEHKGSSIESAREHVQTMISDAWKCINETFLSSPFSPHFKAAILDSARMVPLMYCNNEKHRLSNSEKER